MPGARPKRTPWAQQQLKLTKKTNSFKNKSNSNSSLRNYTQMHIWIQFYFQMGSSQLSLHTSKWLQPLPNSQNSSKLHIKHTHLGPHNICTVASLSGHTFTVCHDLPQQWNWREKNDQISKSLCVNYLLAQGGISILCLFIKDN